MIDNCQDIVGEKSCGNIVDSQGVLIHLAGFL
jgi:hypothetical protein